MGYSTYSSSHPSYTFPLTHTHILTLEIHDITLSRKRLKALGLNSSAKVTISLPMHITLIMMAIVTKRPNIKTAFGP